jgi:hypothetical protein
MEGLRTSQAPDSIPLELIDLLSDLDALEQLLAQELQGAIAKLDPEHEKDKLLDAFLLSAAMNQIVEDHIHSGLHLFAALEKRRKLMSGLSGRVVRACGNAFLAMRETFQSGVLAWQMDLKQLTEELASVVAATEDGEQSPPSRIATLAKSADALTRRGRQSRTRRLGRTVLRLPDCFRTFDQRPADCGLLADEFAQRCSRSDQPLLVVGVRTSGSYLAPIQAAFLRRRGFTQVDWITFRPGQRWSEPERQLLSRISAAGVALLVDDPPVSGAKLASSAAELERQGFPRDSIVLLAPVFGEVHALPAALNRWPAVVLPWRRWTINRELQADRLLQTLNCMIRGGEVWFPAVRERRRVFAVEAVVEAPLDPIPEVVNRPLVRSHLRSARRLRVRDAEGETAELDVYIKGTGLGYFGRHSAAVGRRIASDVPVLYGWRDGLLFRQALPASARLTFRGAPPVEVAAAVAEYVGTRARSLEVPVDRSLAMRRRRCAWEITGDFLSAGFGSLAPIAGRLLRPFARRLLQSPRPSVIDGDAGLAHFFWSGTRDTGHQRVMKVHFDERAFSVWDLYSYDPAFDLAAAAADYRVRAGRSGSGQFEARLRTEYAALTGDTVSEERWLLYRLLHLETRRRHLTRLLEQGPGQLQTQAGTPPESPGVDEAGFSEAVLAAIASTELVVTELRNEYRPSADLTAPAAKVVGIVLDVHKSGFAGRAMALVLLALAVVRCQFAPVERRS